MSLTISAADIVQQLRARFGIRGSTDLLLEQNIVPVTNISDIDEPPYHSKRGFVIGNSQAAVAGQNSYVGLLNQPVIANNMPTFAIVKMLALWTFVASNVRIAARTSQSGPVTGGSGPAGSWDTADNGTAGLVTLSTAPLIAGAAASAAAVTIGPQDGFEVFCPANTPLLLPIKWCIRQGSQLLLQTMTQNVGLGASFYGDLYGTE